jgi:hypothetical protein
MDIHTSFVSTIILFDEIFKRADSARVSSYLGTNAKPICVEFSNFVRGHNSVKKNLTCYIM